MNFECTHLIGERHVPTIPTRRLRVDRYRKSELRRQSVVFMATSKSGILPLVPVCVADIDIYHTLVEQDRQGQCPLAMRR